MRFAALLLALYAALAVRSCGIKSDVDAFCYLARYTDLKSSICRHACTTHELNQAKCHFESNGRTEGRIFDCDTPTSTSVPPQLVVGPGLVQMLSPGTVTSAAVVRVQGTLRCGRGVEAAVLRTSRVVVESGGVFECGSASNPITSDVEIELLDGADADGQRGIMVYNGGTLSLHANPSRSRVARLASVALRGSARLHLRLPGVSGHWHVGDDLVVATTSFNRQPSVAQNEERTIAAISADGLVVDLDRPLIFDHYGGNPATFRGTNLTLDEAGYVANLRRPIRIRPAAGAAVGGHIIVHYGGTAHVQGAEIARLGDEGQLGQYPFHWHRAGNVSGQYIRNSSVHHTRQRCIVVHGALEARVLSNLCFDFVGHGIFLEDHDEVANVVSHNLVILARKQTNEAKLLLQSELVDEDIGRFPSPAGIWVSNPDNVITDNVAISSEGTGIWFSFVNNLCCVSYACTVMPAQVVRLAECQAIYGAGAKLTQPRTEPTRECARNVAASNVVGINWDGSAMGALANNPRNPADRSITTVHYAPIQAGNSPPVFSDLVMYKNSNTAAYFRGGHSYFERQVYADNGKGPFFAYNSVIRDSLMVGWSANADVEFYWDASVRIGIRQGGGYTSGLRVYDGPLQVEGVHFAGFPADNDAYAETLPHGLIAAPAAVPFGHVGASERFTSIAAHVSWEGGVAPARRATFPLRDSMAGVLHGQGTVLYDAYGEVTGVSTAANGSAPLTLIGDFPINGDPSCRRLDPGSGAMVCGPGYSTAVLGFTNTGGIAYAYPRFVVVRTSSGATPTPAERVAAWDSLGHPRHVILKMNRNPASPVDHYHLIKIGWGHANQKIVFRTDYMNDLSPPIHFHWEIHQCVGMGVRVFGSAPFAVQPDAASVVSASAGAVFYDDAARTLVMRVQATRERCSDAGFITCGAGPPGNARFAAGSLPGGERTADHQSEWFTLRCADDTHMQLSTTETLEAIPQTLKVNIDFVRAVADGVRVRGWACVLGRAAPAFVQAIVHSATGEALELLPPTATAQTTEAAILQACGGTPSGSMHRFDSTLQLPSGKIWVEFNLLTLNLGGTPTTMLPYGRSIPVPTAGTTTQSREDRIAKFKAYRASLRADARWGYVLPPPSPPFAPFSPPGQQPIVVVAFTMRTSGSLEQFTPAVRASIAEEVARQITGVGASDVTVTVTAGSVLISVSIATTTAASAAILSQSSALTPQTATLMLASVTVGGEPITISQIVSAAAVVPLTGTSPTPPEAGTSNDAVNIAAAAAGGGALLLLVAGIVAWRLHKRRAVLDGIKA